MKKVGKYLVIGILIAFIGVIFANVFAAVFNGLPKDTGMILGMGAYLCVVIIICTGIIAEK